MRRINKKLAILLALCLLMSALFVPVSAVTVLGGECVANDGSNASGTVSLQHDCKNGQISVSQESAAYGDAIGLVTGDEGCGWNNYKTGIRISVPVNYDISAATGFAFYAKFPRVEGNTSLDIMWYINDSAYWHELDLSKEIYYLTEGSDTLEAATGSLPGYGKAGWEGFIFVPFDNLKTKYDGEDRNIINQNYTYELRVGISGTDATLANQTFIFDELGLYTTPADYVEAVTYVPEEETVEDGIVVNDGSDAEGTTALQHDCTDGQITIGQEAGGVYGDAISFTTGTVGSHWNWYKTDLFVNVPSDYEVSKATGFAFYAKFPETESDTALDIVWYINDNAYWHELCQGQPIYYVENGSTTVEESIFSWGDYTLPGHNKAGWEGFIFVPFTSLNWKYDGTDRDIINAAKNFRLRVGICVDNDANAEQTYIFDEIGLYTTPANYVKKAVVHKNTNLIKITGDDDAVVKPQHNVTNQVTVESVKDVSPYGGALAMTTGDVGCGWNNYKTGFYMGRNGDDLSKMTGFAFYMEVPEVEGADTALDLWLWNTDQKIFNEFKNGAPIYYVESGSNIVTSTNFSWGDYTLPAHNMSGWKGFVFIPFTSMCNTWGGEGIDVENLNNYDFFEVRMSVAKTDDVLANKTWIFDEFGYYTDMLEYVNFVEEDHKIRNYADPVDIVVNDGASGNGWSDDGTGGWTVSPYSTDNTGRGFSMYSGGDHPNYYWAYFPLPKGDIDVSATKGIAFYVEIPDDLDNCHMQVALADDDGNFRNDPILNKMYYVEDGSDTVEEQTTQQGYYPFNGKKGFKGWFFLPYAAMQKNGTTYDAKAVNKATNFRVQLCVISGDAADHGRTYVVDQLGYYSDPLTYIANATEGFGYAGDPTGDELVEADDIAEICKVILKQTAATDKVYQTCDCNKDGYIDIRDMVNLKKLLVL